MSETTPVEVSECTMNATFAPLSASARATSSAAGVWPHSYVSGTTSHAERGPELLPARAELAVRDDERLLTRGEEVHERRLERAGAGRGEEEHVVLRAEDLAQARVGLAGTPT